MGLFSLSRARLVHRDPAPEPEASDAAPALRPAPPPRSAAAAARSLRDSLQQLYSIRPSRDSFAEEAIKLIASAAGVRGAALLGYEARHSRINLMASVGLEHESLQVLSGEAAFGSWDIPLRSLRNRRINVIESAHENPFVPKALVAMSPRRLTIATIPFYHANSAVGVVVLFSPTQRGFADGLLHTLSQGLRVCALALAELPAAGAFEGHRAVEPCVPEQPNLLRGLAALKAELVRLTQALEEAERQRAAEAAERVTAQSFLQAARERTALLEKEVAKLREQSERLPVLEEQVQELARQLREAVQATEAARAETTRLQAAHAEIAQREEGKVNALTALAAARDALQQQLDAALVVARERGESLAALESRLAELTERAAQLEDVRRAAVAAEEARQQASAELSHVRNELAEAQAEGAARAAALERANTALRAAQEETRSLAHQLTEVQGRLQQVDVQRDGMEAARQELQAAAAARDALQREVDALRAAAAAGATAVEETDRVRMEAEHDLQTLRAELAEAIRGREALRERVARAAQEEVAREQAVEEAARERARLQAALDELKTAHTELSARAEAATCAAAELRREREEAGKRVAALEAQLRATRAQLVADAETRLREAEAAHRAADAALRERHSAEVASLNAQLAALRDQFGEQLAALHAERERLIQALAEKDLLLQSAEAGLTTIDLAADADGADSLAIDRSCAPGHEGPGELDEVEDTEAVADEVVLLDEEEIGTNTARHLVEFGHRVTTLPPEPESTLQLGERPIACAAINLAIPTAWRTVRRLRNGTGIQRMPLIAYALAANAPKGFWLGPVDFAILPVDANSLPEILARMVPRARRVIAMSNDIDVMGDVRTQLAAANISTAVVLDGRQALDLVSTVRPEAAVLHLSPSCVDVFRAIAGLRSADISREIPILFLLDADPQPREEAFLTAGVRMLYGRGNLAAADLVDTLASALGAYRASGAGIPVAGLSREVEGRRDFRSPYRDS